MFLSDYLYQVKACAAEKPFDEPQPEYSEGRESISFKHEETAHTLGGELKEEAEKLDAEEEKKEVGAPSDQE